MVSSKLAIRGFNFIARRGAAVRGVRYLRPREIPNIKALKYVPKPKVDVFKTNVNQSETYEKITNGILAHAPKAKHKELMEIYQNFVKNGSDLKVIEQLFSAAEREFKGIPEKDLIQRFNKIFKNINTLRINNPEDYEIMVKGGFFDLIEQGKIPLSNFRTNLQHARISRALLNDLKRVAKNEPYIPNYTNLSASEISKAVKNGDVYEVNGKLFTRNNGVEHELQLSREKFEELFPPVLRHISMQGNIGNCWFVSRLNNLMATESGSSGIYSLFRQAGNDIYIKFPNCSKEILFPNGHVLKSLSGKQMNAVPGLSMIEQAYAVHRTGLYAKGAVTNIETFKNADRLMGNLDGASLRAIYLHDEAKNKDVLDLISNEYTYNVAGYDNLIGGFRRFIDKYVLNKNIFNRFTSKSSMRGIIDSQANANNLKINVTFRKSEQSFEDLYNMVPNHQLMLSSVDSGRYWITNPWFSWLEKGVDRGTFYRYLNDAQIPMQW